MKKVTLLCALLLATTASIAAASGVGLRWSACLSDAGTQNRAFACTSNAGSNLLVGTFTLGPAGLASVSGNEIVIDLASASATLPAWWSFFAAGTCRQSSLTMNFVISATALNCADWALGLSSGGIGAYQIGLRGPNTARIKAALAVAPANVQTLAGGQEYFAFNLIVNNAKTVFTGACAGCTVPVCIVFNSVNVTTPVLANNVKLSGPSNATDGDFATWQGGAGVSVGAAVGCPAATPTRSETWGQVKALYR